MTDEPLFELPEDENEKPDADGIERDYQPTGKFSGNDATPTERESGDAVEKRDAGPLKKGKAGHTFLRVYADGKRRSAYEASHICTGDYHSRRREATRLMDRGFLSKEGEVPNPAPLGRPNVDAYRITAEGRTELDRLDRA